MVTGCLHIDQAVKLAIDAGHEIYNISDRDNENNKIVIDMYDPLSPQLKEKIDRSCVGLRYWEFKGVPHNSAESGYTCEEDNVVLIFPNCSTPRAR